jgi:hypothetical protein
MQEQASPLPKKAGMLVVLGIVAILAAKLKFSNI